VAEVFFGDLLKPLSTTITPETELDEVQYDFIDEGIRDIFLEFSTRSESSKVLEAVSRYVARHLGKNLVEFNALVKKPTSEKASIKGFKIKPFARIQAKVLKRLGGVYTALANELETIAQEKPLGKNYAIAIGINQYRNPASRLPAAQHAVRDAAVMQQWFRQRGFERVDLLIDVSPPNISESPPPPTHAGWRQFWQANFSQGALSAEDTLWFYFCGYGVHRRGRDYLFLADSDLEKLEETALPLTNLVRLLQSSGAGKVILLLDADCEATTTDFASDKVSSLEQQFREEISGERELIIFYASSPEQGAYDIAQLQQGSFTYALREALLSTQGNLSIERLKKFLSDRVTELNRQYKRPTQSPQSFIFPPNLQEWIPFPSSLQVFDCKTPTVNRGGKIIKQDTKLVQYYTEDLGNDITLDMVAIPGGKFKMGAAENEKYANSNEYPQHDVTVQPFFMGKYPVTQAQWRAIADRTDLKIEGGQDLNPNPAYFKNRKNSDRRPVEQVNWYDANEFCARLSKLTGREYRLPSEAEWEYACRAGTTTPFYFGETITGELANYDASDTYADEPKGEYRKETTPVGEFPPNAFGLYDMHGNVWEWCADTWHETYKGAPSDGSAWTSGNENRSPLRGGSSLYLPSSCRSANRNLYIVGRDSFDQHYGFRVACGVGRTL
jgi:formylglycine-generating enzyme required for sulfatase activity